ncbi:carboxypeptidase-like regulatory domain-containing protein, partial [Chitinophaga sp.]|uniref:TonB-dependent receptor n=1 Tax=Chitinophaga sp. TaxID=1869181 RepID=UPI002F947535
MKRSICLFFITLGMLMCSEVFAQSTLADLNGQVKGKDGTMIPGASITVRNESTGFTNRTQSNTKGLYTFKQLPLGGPYTITVSAMGFGSQKKQDYNLNQGDALQVNFDLEPSVSNLDAVTIVSTSNKKAIVNAGAATTITPTDMNRLPVNGRNFSNLAALSPLTGNGNSISGQLGSGTNYTIDGMTAKNPTSAGPTTSRSGAPYSISIEAVREFKVVTNQYDVTLGRSGGGTVSAVTKSGTNTVSGSVFGFGRANWLSSPYDIRGNKRNNDYSTYQFGGSIGGPIIKDKLHYFFAWDHQTDNRSLVIADIQSNSDELVYNITRNVLDTFVNIARTKYGVSNHAQ